MDFKLELNLSELNRELDASFAEANEALEPAFKAEIEADKWPPDNRDIVDTGDLRDSYEGFEGDARYDHAWTVDYAKAVHEGAVLGNGGRMIARPWTEEPLETLPDEFRKAFER